MIVYPHAQGLARQSGLPVNELISGMLGKMPLEVALGIVHAVARLLDATHAAGKVHGALSTASVWCSSSGGIFLEWSPQKDPVHRALPPEQRQGGRATPACDVYALGAVAYELLTGLTVSRAWARAPLVELQHVASPAHFNTAVPTTVDAVVAASLSRDPAGRPRSVSALACAVESTVAPGSWTPALVALLGDTFFTPAIRELPATCEGATLAPLPPPLPSPPPPAKSPPKLVVAPPMSGLSPEVLASASGEHHLPPSGRSALPMVKIMVATVAAAALSLSVSLWVARSMSEQTPHVVAAPPPPVAWEPVQVPAEPSRLSQDVPQPLVKAERPTPMKRKSVPPHGKRKHH